MDCPPWLLQESGYALALQKRLILFRELDVEISGLQGDLEYIAFDPSNPTPAIQHANEVINSLITDLRGISVHTTLEVAQTAQPSSPDAPKLEEVLEKASKDEISVVHDSIKDVLFAALQERDWKRFDEFLPRHPAPCAP